MIAWLLFASAVALAVGLAVVLRQHRAAAAATVVRLETAAEAAEATVARLKTAAAVAVVEAENEQLRHRAALREVEAAARADSKKIGRSTRDGQAAERMAAWLPGYPHDPSDARHLGGLADHVVFARDRWRVLQHVYLVEMKNAGSGESDAQRELEAVIRDGRVSWQLLRTAGEPDGSLRCHHVRTTPVHLPLEVGAGEPPVALARARRAVLVRSEDWPAGRKLRLGRPRESPDSSSPPESGGPPA